MMNKRFIPNAATLSNLICGCIATGAAFHGHFTTAFLFILCGGAFDFLDGFLSRVLKAPSPLGVELDSLSDVVTFGVAPSAMLFTLFTKVCYPSFMSNGFWFTLLPYTAFLLAAFSAYRLAKFNLDTRQHTGFIGMPTPACAIFWGALISGSLDYLTSLRFNAPFLFLFVLLSCFLLVSDVPMLAFKFRRLGVSDRLDRLRYGFLVVAALLIICFALFAPAGMVWAYVCKAIAIIIGLYALLGFGLLYAQRREE